MRRMERTQGRAFRQSGVLVLVFTGHVLLLLFISSSRYSNTDKGLARADAPATLLLLNVEQRAEPPPVKQVLAIPHTARASHTREDRRRKTPSEVPGDNGETSATITAPDESHSIPKIDWQFEIEIAVQAMTPKMVKEEQRRCAARPLKGPLVPPQLTCLKQVEGGWAHARPDRACRERSFVLGGALTDPHFCINAEAIGLAPWPTTAQTGEPRI